MGESQIVTNPRQEKELAPKYELTHCFLHPESTGIRKLRAVSTPSTHSLVSPVREFRAPRVSTEFRAGARQEGEEYFQVQKQENT